MFFDYFFSDNLFKAIVAKAITPSATNKPTIPFNRYGRLIIKLLKLNIYLPSYKKNPRIKPPAITEAIWPDTLTPIECISRKF